MERSKPQERSTYTKLEPRAESALMEDPSGARPSPRSDAPDLESKPRARTIEDLGLPEEAEQVDLDEDVYGAVIFSVVYDSFELMTDENHDGLPYGINAYRMFFCLLLILANYCLQIGLIIIVYRFVAQPSMHAAQTVYKRYHTEVFVAGVFQQDRWDTWDGADALCNIAFGNYWFMYAILCLWWVTMAIEVRKTQRLYASFKSLGNSSDPTQLCRRVDVPEKLNIILNLTSWQRAVLYLVVLMPKLVVPSGLLFVGTIWLAATDSFENLVLNSVALGFIINIDEVIFAGLVPYTMKKNINITKLINMEGNDGHFWEVVKGYRESTILLMMITAGVAVYMSNLGQSIQGIGIFPGYLADLPGCPSWWERRREEVCAAGVDCFTMA